MTEQEILMIRLRALNPRDGRILQGWGALTWHLLRRMISWYPRRERLDSPFGPIIARYLRKRMEDSVLVTGF